MSRRATGGVVPPKGQRRSWAMRFRAYGKRYTITLGRTEDGWNRKRAEDELAIVLADVRRGVWRPPEPDAKSMRIQREPTFREFAEEWFAEASSEWRDSTRMNCRWRLDGHLFPFFADHKLSAITVKEVDHYRRQKVRRSKVLEEERRELVLKGPSVARMDLPRPLSNGTINKTIRLLAAILELAVEYRHIDRNPAKGRKRLLRESKPVRSYLQPGQVDALLTAAAGLDERARDGGDGRRQPLLTVLVLAGLRVGEALDLRWRDINLAERKLWVGEAKTAAGIREVDLTPSLQKLLSQYRSRSRHNGPDDRVFPTKKGKRDNRSNVRNRFLASAVQQANKELRKGGHQEIGHITPHSLRRTFISLLLVSGADFPYVMAQAGHTDPRMTLGIYAQVITSRTDHGAALDGLIKPVNGTQ